VLALAAKPPEAQAFRQLSVPGAVRHAAALDRSEPTIQSVASRLMATWRTQHPANLQVQDWHPKGVARAAM
jgi:hypothetical protein